MLTGFRQDASPSEAIALVSGLYSPPLKRIWQEIAIQFRPILREDWHIEAPPSEPRSKNESVLIFRATTRLLYLAKEYYE